MFAIPSTTHKTSDTGMKLRQMKRFWQIVVSPKFKAFNFIIDRIAGGKYDDVAIDFLFCQFFKQTKSIAIRQHDIQQHTVVFIEKEFGTSLIQGGCRLHHIASFNKRLAYHLLHSLVVFDYKYFHVLYFYPINVTRYKGIIFLQNSLTTCSIADLTIFKQENEFRIHGKIFCCNFCFFSFCL